MAVQVQRRGGTTVQHDAFVGANREITVDTTKKTLVVHDGVTQVGHPLAREDILNANIGMPRGYIDGLSLMIDADPRKLNVTDGACKTSDHAGSVLYTGTTNIDLNVSGDNGIISGTLSPHNWYNVLVGNKAGVPVAGFSVPNQKPVSWDNFRRIGSIKTDVNSNIRPFIQIGDYFFWNETSVEVESVWVGSAFQALIINVPEGVRSLAMLTGSVAHTNANGNSIGLAVRTPGTTNSGSFC